MLMKLLSRHLKLEDKASSIGEDTITVALLAGGILLIWVALQSNTDIKKGVLTLLV